MIEMKERENRLTKKKEERAQGASDKDEGAQVVSEEAPDEAMKYPTKTKERTMKKNKKKTKERTTLQPARKTDQL
jgi:hypothetical protein